MEDLLHAPFIMFITSVLFHVVLYMQVLPSEEELPGLKQDFPPFILIAGELPNYDDIFIVAKGERILNVSGGHLVALKCLVCFYYTQACQACTNTFYTFSRRNTLSKSSIHTKFLSMRQNLVLPSAIVCDHDRRIAEVCFHMIADDRRTVCDLRSSAIIWKPAFMDLG